MDHLPQLDAARLPGESQKKPDSAASAKPDQESGWLLRTFDSTSPPIRLFVPSLAGIVLFHRILRKAGAPMFHASTRRKTGRTVCINSSVFGRGMRTPYSPRLAPDSGAGVFHCANDLAKIGFLNRFRYAKLIWLRFSHLVARRAGLLVRTS